MYLFFSIFFSLAQKYLDFLNYEAYYLIFPEEKEVFLSLKEDYQRDLFIEEFWKRRDPFPDTYENEFKEPFLLRLEEGKNLFGFNDPRTRFYALFGPPDEIIKIECERYFPSFIWKYKRLEQISSSAILLFFQPYGVGNFKIFDGTNENEIYSSEKKGEICFEKIYVEQAISWGKNAILDGRMGKLLSPPPVDLEDVKDILKRTIILPESFEPLKGSFSLEFKAGSKGKTYLCGTILLEDFLKEGVEIKIEVIKENKLYDFSKLRYYFKDTKPPYPASFNLELFPGKYELRIFASSIDEKKGLKIFEKINVPLIEPENFKKKLEEEFKISSPFLETPHRGIVQFLIKTPSNVKKVKYFLDDNFIAQKNLPPFDIEIDLGSVPLPHIFEAVGYDEEEKEIGRDIFFINQGMEPLKVKIIYPRGNIFYYNNVDFKAEVLIPEGKKLKNLQVYEADELLLEFFKPPFEGKISIPFKKNPVIRALLNLEDGSSAEDTVVLNSSGFEETLNINNVTLNLSVLNNSGKPVTGLKKEDFELYEDGKKQQIIEFLEAKDLNLNICFLIDISASMEPYLENVKKAVLFFSENFLREKDKLTIIAFNNFPRIIIKNSNNLEEIKGALSHLISEGYTNLYDSIVFSLYQYQATEQRTALIILSDGKDTGSSYSFEDTLNYLKHLRTIVYTIAINIKFSDLGPRNVLTKIAESTGGSFFSISPSELNDTYKRIIEELRSQYIISYVSNQTGSEFRKIKVKCKKGYQVRTISGYFP